MNKILKLIGAILLSGIIGIDIGFSSGSNGEIYNLKAAFIYNFTKYITWPYLDKSPTFKVGVIGDSQIIESLREMAKKKQVSDKAIEVLHFNNPNEIQYCHILFVSSSLADSLKPILFNLKRRAVLTIGDTPGFGDSGLMINFYMHENAIKFEVNTAKLETAGLKVSSQLLKLARIIG